VLGNSQQKSLIFFYFFFPFSFTDDENWGGMCSTGRRQSPVDLVKEAAVAGKYTGFVFQNYDTPMRSVVIVNNGHSSE
jgi:carbonic anhydrase